MEQKNVILAEYFKGLASTDLIQSSIGPKRIIEIIDNIEKTMQEYSNEISYTQMRNIYSVLQSTKDVTGIHKVRPRIAYIQARLDKPKAKDITIFIMEIMREITDINQVKPFLELMETMVAFHKLYNKNNSN